MLCNQSVNTGDYPVDDAVDALETLLVRERQHMLNRMKSFIQGVETRSEKP